MGITTVSCGLFAGVGTNISHCTEFPNI